jgi:hypothetical protein
MLDNTIHNMCKLTDRLYELMIQIMTNDAGPCTGS